jgi:glycerophosphoryl diester phosphodiesterase
LPEKKVRMKIIAHRGDSRLAPENTLAAIRLAWERAADLVEIDLHLTRDGHPVVIHDPSTKRTTGKNWIVKNRTLRELKTLDAGRWKHPEWESETIPTLEEALTATPAGKTLLLEIKCGMEILTPLADIFSRSATPSHAVALTGFDLDVMREAKTRFPNLTAYWNAAVRSFSTPNRRARAIADLTQKARQAHLNGLCLRHNPAIDRASVDRVHAEGLKLFVWTVDSIATARVLAAHGADGIVTNCPGHLRARLAAPLKHPRAD